MIYASSRLDDDRLARALEELQGIKESYRRACGNGAVGNPLEVGGDRKADLKQSELSGRGGALVPPRPVSEDRE